MITEENREEVRIRRQLLNGHLDKMMSFQSNFISNIANHNYQNASQDLQRIANEIQEIYETLVRLDELES